MAKKMVRPVIDVETFYEGNATIYEVFGKVYARMFSEKLKEEKSVPLQNTNKKDTVKSS